MGRHNTFLVGEGKNKAAAFERAWEEYVYENGHRNSFDRHVTSKLLEKVPPMETVSRTVGRTEYISSERNPKAPPEKWLEKWEFEIWVRA